MNVGRGCMGKPNDMVPFFVGEVVDGEHPIFGSISFLAFACRFPRHVVEVLVCFNVREKYDLYKNWLPWRSISPIMAGDRLQETRGPGNYGNRAKTF